MLRIAEFEPIAAANGALYRPRVYGDPRGDRWDGYVVFFPIGSGAVVSTPPETTQASFESLQVWASGLDAVYLEGALSRALAATRGVAMPATLTEFDLAAAETLAAGDAVALHNAAERAAAESESARIAAEMHEQAAAAARESAERLARKHDELEELARETTRLTAEAVATSHELAASEARAIASDAARTEREKARPRARRRSSSPRNKKRGS